MTQRVEHSARSGLFCALLRLALPDSAHHMFAVDKHLSILILFYLQLNPSRCCIAGEQLVSRCQIKVPSQSNARASIRG